MFLETKEAGEIQQAPAKVLKLSEAMRIGAATLPQCTGVMCSGYAVCALGAIAVGRGWEPSKFWRPGEFEKFLPEFNNDEQHMGNKDSLFHKIGQRNDDGMTREQIADWLEGQGL